ncbi:MAG TPA: serine/threonine-protein kinase [Polyangia bacterium]
MVLAGAALGAVSFRQASSDRARTDADAAAAVTAEREAHAAAELRAIEQSARQAAAIEPLISAVKMNVDGETWTDLFDNEDWWRTYRGQFTFSRLIVNGNVVSTRGTADVGILDKPVAKQARLQGTASALVSVGGHPYMLAAARLPIASEHAPIVVLGREPALAPAPAVARVAPAAPAFPVRPLQLGVAGVVALAGLMLVFVGRRAPPRQEAVPAVPLAPSESQGAPVSGFYAPAPVPTTGPSQWQENAGRPALVAVSDTGTTALPNAGPTGAIPSHAAMLGRYRLLDRLGEGGMAELFVAEASGVEGFSRTFVLKRLRAELAKEKDAVAQFVDEARLQASLVHSNIVPVFDFGMAGSQYFMTQEYILGRDLARLMERHQMRGGRGMPADIAYFIAHEVLQALAYAHDTHDKNGNPLGIVHRDVSAGNVMVSFQGEVKLSDFGIVKSNRRVSKTQVGMVKGNANFMSPEQARGHNVDARSDLFSLGLVLLYCLTGELLYWGDNDLDTLYRAATGPTGEDMTAIMALPPPAASILTRALALEPGDRFQSAAEFSDALAPHVGSGKHAIARMMQRLFAEEMRRQTGRHTA